MGVLKKQKMELSNFLSKYWLKALNQSKRCSVPAAYLLAHAYIATNAGTEESETFSHGFDFVVKKNWFDNLIESIKKFFSKKKVAVIASYDDRDCVERFLENTYYHFKFVNIQSMDRMADYLYKGMANEKKLVSDFVDVATKILQY